MTGTAAEPPVDVEPGSDVAVESSEVGVVKVEELESSLAGRLVMPAIAVAAIVIVLLAAVTVHARSQRSADHRREAAAAAMYLVGPSARAAQLAAVRETRATLSYNYATLPADFAAAERGLTLRMVASYRKTAAGSVTPLARRYHAVSRATVESEGVSAATADTATVLLFVDQTVTNSQLAQPRLDRTRIKASMVKVNGRWLIDALSPL